MILTVYMLKCAGCGHVVTAAHEDSTKAAMIDHLMFAHPNPEVPREEVQ